MTDPPDPETWNEREQSIYLAGVRAGLLRQHTHDPFVQMPPLTRRECQAAYAALDKALEGWPTMDLTDVDEDDFKRQVLIWNSLRTAFGEAIANHRDVVSVYLWQNGVVMVFDFAGEQIFELQGVRSDELEAKIRARATVETQWHGFPPDEPCLWGSFIPPA